MADDSQVAMGEAVAQVVSITSADSAERQQQFRHALEKRSFKERVSQDVIMAVINEYFDDPDKFGQTHIDQHQWDEGPFMANRDGSNPNTSAYTTSQGIVVQGPDVTASGDSQWQQPNNLAPSRPPSRAHNRSPLGRIAEWATEGIHGGGNQAETEDEQLQKAMAASMQDQGPQENGVMVPMDENLPYFGPATRAAYDPKDWAVTTTRASASDPTPSQRKRTTGMPVFLTCRLQQDRHCLGPLMMILHEIPSARNFFLLLEGASQSYGNSREWWRGDRILATNQTDDMWTPDYQDVSLVDELQRLTAFLDLTDRTYGTADSLGENQMVKSAWGDVVVRFYESIYNCSNSQELSRMWTTVKVENTSGESRPQEFAILDFRIPDGTPEVFCNIYSQWDSLFWINQEDGTQGWESRQDDELTQIASIQTPAQVMTMRVTTEGPRIDVPEILYIDRYLESNVQTARTMQRKMFKMWAAIDAVVRKESDASQWTAPDSFKPVDKSVLAKRIIERSENEIWQIRANALWRMHEESAHTEDPLPYLPDELNHLAQLDEDEDKAVKHHEASIGLAKLKLANIDRKLALMRAEKEACCAVLKQLNQTLTVPSDDPALNPKHKYHLRGVIASPDELYMCRPGDHESETDDAVKNSLEPHQWSKCSWVSGAESPVKFEKTTIENVKDAMFTKDKDNKIAPILVYATEEALNEQPNLLSSALQTFVKHDNRLFGQDLKEEAPSRDKKRVAIRSPQSPPKRKRSDSADSMATNRASTGDFSDSEDRAALLADQFDGVFGNDDGVDIVFGDDDAMDTELTDMHPISHDEIAAHIVPPTPPLSADEASDQDSAGLRRSSEKLANFSLDDGQQEMGKAPEMEELKVPYIVRRPASSPDNRASIMEAPMEIDANLEIPGVNPEEYYQKTH